MSWREKFEEVKALAKEGSIELREALLALEEELASFEESQELLYEAPLYWRVRGERREGPFCQVCWDASHKLIHLQKERGVDWVCKVCANTFGEDKTSPFQYNPPF